MLLRDMKFNKEEVQKLQCDLGVNSQIATPDQLTTCGSIGTFHISCLELLPVIVLIHFLKSFALFPATRRVKTGGLEVITWDIHETSATLSALDLQVCWWRGTST